MPAPPSSNPGVVAKSFVEILDQSSMTSAALSGIPESVDPQAEQQSTPRSGSAVINPNNRSARFSDPKSPDAKPSGPQSRSEGSVITSKVPNSLTSLLRPAPIVDSPVQLSQVLSWTGAERTHNLNSDSFRSSADPATSLPNSDEAKSSMSPAQQANSSQLVSHVSSFQALERDPAGTISVAASANWSGAAASPASKANDSTIGDSRQLAVISNQIPLSGSDSPAKAASSLENQSTENQSTAPSVFDSQTAAEYVARALFNAGSNLHLSNPQQSNLKSSPIGPADSLGAEIHRPNADALPAKSLSFTGAMVRADVSGDGTESQAPVKDGVPSLLQYTAAPDSGTQPDNLALPLRDAPREAPTGDTAATVAPNSGTDLLVLSGVVPQAFVFPVASSLYRSSNGRVSPAKPTSYPTRASDAQAGVKPEVAGTRTKNEEANGETKALTQNSSSHAADASMMEPAKEKTSAKAVETSPSLAVSENQNVTISSESKEANSNSSLRESQPRTTPFAAESSGIAANHAQPELPAAYPTSLMNSARLIERMGEAELRLGMRAGEYGNVDIRTSMVRNQFTAEISVERGELGRAMAADLPGLQDRLAEQRLPVTNIILQDHSGSPSNAGEQHKPRGGQPVYESNSVKNEDEVPMSAVAALEANISSSRLDIHM